MQLLFLPNVGFLKPVLLHIFERKLNLRMSHRTALMSVDSLSSGGQVRL